MVKRWFIVGGILLLASLLMLGCGVPQDDYDAVVAERDSTKAELQSVSSELGAAQAEASDLSLELDGKDQQLSEIRQIYDSLKPKLDMYGLLGEYITKQGWRMLSNPSYTFSQWEYFANDIFRLGMEDYLGAVDDPGLRIRYEQAVIWHADGDWTTDFEYFDKLLTELGALIEADIAELETALAD